MDIATAAQLLSSIATLVVALGILYQGRQARKARDDQDRPQIIVDADYTGRFTTALLGQQILDLCDLSLTPHEAGQL
jgi:hypothetical protein